MPREQITSTLTGNVGGTVNIPAHWDELNTLATNIQQLTTAVNGLTQQMNSSMFGPTAKTVSGSLANSSACVASALRGIAGLDKDGNKKSAEGLAALGQIARALGGISSAVNTGVAMNVIATTDQIKKNAFDKEATQQALARNNLPTVTVTQTNFLQTVQTTITEGGSMFAQAQAVGLVNSTASAAISGAASWAYDLLPNGSTIINWAKGLVPASAPTSDPTGNVERNKTEVELAKPIWT